LIRKLLIAFLFLLLVLVASCSLFLPERFAINVPLASMLLGRTADAPSAEQIDNRFQVPEGFSVSIYAEGLGNARWMKVTGSGDILLTRPRTGDVVLVKADADGDGRSDAIVPLLEGLNKPHGVELNDGWLYIGETDAIGRIRFDEATGTVSGELDRIISGLPGGGNHWTKNLGFGPDGLLYLSIGSTCNVCIEKDERRAAMMRFAPNGSGGEIVARGLRNSVGFDWQPGTDKLFATDNGRDLLGDDYPPCELNEVNMGSFYGWPYANGDNHPDPDFGEGQAERIASSTPPAFDFNAHNAPLGMQFIKHNRVPAPLHNAALVALHGSWNRTSKDGYKVVSLAWQPDGSIVEKDFLTGFEVDDDVVGRPVHVVEAADGSFYISDDYSGTIWRVAYGEAQETIVVNTPIAEQAPLSGIPAAERAALALRGQALYLEHKCAVCHDAAQAVPGVAVKELNQLRGRFDLGTLEALLTTPPPPMPIFPLSAEDKRALSVYLLSEDRQVEH
jgi:glucose/arabinose dehydrogenase